VLMSKTQRPATPGINADLHGHLIKEPAPRLAADSFGSVLNAAAAELANDHAVRAATTSRPQRPEWYLTNGPIKGQSLVSGVTSTVRHPRKSNPRPAHYEMPTPSRYDRY
jgi:hypothetical protein